MNKEFITYELALRLKALGFDELCFAYFKDEEFQYPNPYEPFKNSEMKSWCITAPLYQQAFRWFREKYNIFPEILTDCTTRPKFCYTYTKFFGNQNDLASEEWGWEPNVGQYSLLYKTYEEAQIACLEKLIEIAEQI
jgi:hypothetical protein